MSPRSQEARVDMAGLTKLGNCWEAPCKERTTTKLPVWKD